MQDSCKAMRQFAKGVQNWSSEFNLLCDATDENEKNKKIEKVIFRSNQITNKINDYTNCPK